MMMLMMIVILILIWRLIIFRSRTVVQWGKLCSTCVSFREAPYICIWRRGCLRSLGLPKVIIIQNTQKSSCEIFVYYKKSVYSATTTGCHIIFMYYQNSLCSTLPKVSILQYYTSHYNENPTLLYNFHFIQDEPGFIGFIFH